MLVGRGAVFFSDGYIAFDGRRKVEEVETRRRFQGYPFRQLSATHCHEEAPLIFGIGWFVCFCSSLLFRSGTP